MDGWMDEWMDRWIGVWVRCLSAPMHLCLMDRPFVPHIKSWEPHNPTIVPDGLQAQTFNILWLQEEEAQMLMSEREARLLHSHRM